jgi:hypothetical protein
VALALGTLLPSRSSVIVLNGDRIGVSPNCELVEMPLTKSLQCRALEISLKGRSR